MSVYACNVCAGCEHEDYCLWKNDFVGETEAVILVAKDSEVSQVTIKCRYAKSNREDEEHVVHGRWRHIQQYTVFRKECSVCYATHLCESNYCPNCGAKMDLEG